MKGVLFLDRTLARWRCGRDALHNRVGEVPPSEPICVNQRRRGSLTSAATIATVLSLGDSCDAGALCGAGDAPIGGAGACEGPVPRPWVTRGLLLGAPRLATLHSGNTRGVLFAIQLVVPLIEIVWVVTLSAMMFGLLRVAGIFRVSAEDEQQGLDSSKHGGSAYPNQVVESTTVGNKA